MGDSTATMLWFMENVWPSNNLWSMTFQQFKLIFFFMDCPGQHYVCADVTWDDPVVWSSVHRYHSCMVFLLYGYVDGLSRCRPGWSSCCTKCTCVVSPVCEYADAAWGSTVGWICSHTACRCRACLRSDCIGAFAGHWRTSTLSHSGCTGGDRPAGGHVGALLGCRPEWTSYHTGYMCKQHLKWLLQKPCCLLMLVQH